MMIRFLLILSLALFQQAEPIKAISYNIRYNSPKDGMNVWENRKATVSAFLNEENADFVGLQEDRCGDMYLQRTLEDWAKFNINNRTKHDASISSGLAIMACNKNKYTPVAKKEYKKISLGIRKYDNNGFTSKII